MMRSILKSCFILFFVTACSLSPTELWLQEYKVLLAQGVEVFAQDPYSPQMEDIKVRIADKEAQINNLLSNSSTQEQMSFLSEYYEVRVNFYYSVVKE